MDEHSEPTATAVVAEYTMRLRNAVCLSRMAKEVLLNPKKSKGLTAEQREELNEDVQRAAMLADRGFRFNLLGDVGDIIGVWLALEGIIIREEIEGTTVTCTTVPGCAAERICAMNKILDRKRADGFKALIPAKLHYPVPYDAMSDGCPVMVPRPAAMVEYADACDDTASVGRAR
jgi:hypothetical protein